MAGLGNIGIRSGRVRNKILYKTRLISKDVPNRERTIIRYSKRACRDGLYAEVQARVGG